MQYKPTRIARTFYVSAGQPPIERITDGSREALDVELMQRFVSNPQTKTLESAVTTSGIRRLHTWWPPSLIYGLVIVRTPGRPEDAIASDFTPSISVQHTSPPGFSTCCKPLNLPYWAAYALLK